MTMKILKKQTNAKDCIVCGTENPFSVRASFYEMEDGSLCALFQYDPNHQSYPERTHGGLISSIIDETIGRAIWITHPNQYACTLRLEIEFHKGVPYGVPLKCVARIDKENAMTFQGHAEILTMDNVMLAKGKALYMFLKMEQISPTTDINLDDLNVMVEDDLTEIDIPEAK